MATSKYENAYVKFYGPPTCVNSPYWVGYGVSTCLFNRDKYSRHGKPQLGTFVLHQSNKLGLLTPVWKTHYWAGHYHKHFASDFEQGKGNTKHHINPVVLIFKFRLFIFRLYLYIYTSIILYEIV